MNKFVKILVGVVGAVGLSASSISDTIPLYYWDSIMGWVQSDGSIVVKSGGQQWAPQKHAPHVIQDWLFNLRRGNDWMKIIDTDENNKILGIRSVHKDELYMAN